MKKNTREERKKGVEKEEEEERNAFTLAGLKNKKEKRLKRVRL